VRRAYRVKLKWFRVMKWLSMSSSTDSSNLIEPLPSLFLPTTETMSVQVAL